MRSGLTALASGFLMAIVFAFVFALCIKALGKTPAAYNLGLRPVSSLINSPNLFSVVVAVLAGIVGVVSLAESRANALIGVFISITTIPAAADVGVSLAYQSSSEASGSAIQLLLNVGLLIITGALTIRLIKSFWHEPTGRKNAAEVPAREWPGSSSIGDDAFGQHSDGLLVHLSSARPGFAITGRIHD